MSSEFYAFSDILHNQVEGGDRGQGDDSGKNDTETQGNGHGDEKARLAGRFEHHWCQAAECSQGRQQNRTEAAKGNDPLECITNLSADFGGVEAQALSLFTYLECELDFTVAGAAVDIFCGRELVSCCFCRS